MAERSSAQRMLRRYGPIAGVVVLVVGAILIFGGNDDDGDDVDAGPETSSDGLPIIFQEAENPDDIDWGDGCDTETGRMKIPVQDAAPCIEPFDEGDDNGGATAQGVTADSVKVVIYQGEPDPLQQATVEDAGANVDPAKTAAMASDYLKLLEDVYETYGRTLDIEIVPASGDGADATAAQADARKIIDMKPFAVLGGPAQTPVYWQEIVNAGILCIGGCSLAENWDAVDAAAPYLWPTGPTPDQADMLLAEMLGTQLVGGKAEFAGDEALHDQDRVFGWVQAETEAGEYTDRLAAFDKVFEEEYGGEIAARSTYVFDLGRAQETATTVVSRMKDAGVTTVIFSTDPFLPGTISEEATKQNYHPEWVVGPTVLVDTTFFGRSYKDQEQWSHAFGISLPSARADDTLSDSYFVYDWYYGKPPALNTHAVTFPPPEQFMLGLHLAGPELTPENFERGLFRYPPKPGGKTFAHTSWGEETWGRADRNGSDDITVWWWDPTATGEDETGNEGTGMMRYVDGGTRYGPGEFPEDPIPWFEEEGSVTVYDELPEGDGLPDYPPWPGSPAAG